MQMEIPSPGKLLIADPFLKDPNFARSVVLLCEHQEEGSLGFVINKLSPHTLDELLPESTAVKIPVYLGGPVQPDMLHFVHQSPDLIQGGLEIRPGIYWGGDFEQMMELLNIGLLNMHKIKFFIGYSGWGSGQLEGELNEHSWIVSPPDTELVFQEEENNIWQRSLQNMGNDFAVMANYPIDPSLN